MCKVKMIVGDDIALHAVRQQPLCFCLVGAVMDNKHYNRKMVARALVCNSGMLLALQYLILHNDDDGGTNTERVGVGDTSSSRRSAIQLGATMRRKYL